MKTKEELNALKEEVETLNKKLAELTEDELKLVTGGIDLRKDLYENIIIGGSAGEQNGILGEAVNGEMGYNRPKSF